MAIIFGIIFILVSFVLFVTFSALSAKAGVWREEVEKELKDKGKDFDAETITSGLLLAKRMAYAISFLFLAGGAWLIWS